MRIGSYSVLPPCAWAERGGEADAEVEDMAFAVFDDAEGLGGVDGVGSHAELLMQFGEKLGHDVDAAVLAQRARVNGTGGGELPFAGLVDGALGAAAEDDAVGSMDHAADREGAGTDEVDEIGAVHLRDDAAEFGPMAANQARRDDIGTEDPAVEQRTVHADLRLRPDAVDLAVERRRQG